MFKSKHVLLFYCALYTLRYKTTTLIYIYTHKHTLLYIVSTRSSHKTATWTFMALFSSFMNTVHQNPPPPLPSRVKTLRSGSKFSCIRSWIALSPLTTPIDPDEQVFQPSDVHGDTVSGSIWKSGSEWTIAIST